MWLTSGSYMMMVNAEIQRNSGTIKKSHDITDLTQ